MTKETFEYKFVITEDALDENGHVNNVVYLQWMQDAAIKHFDHMGGTEIMQNLGASWFVREHNVKYLTPAFAGEEINVLTWVENLQRARSIRKYMFVRNSDNKTIAKGKTDWVFVNSTTGRPQMIPKEIADLFPPLARKR